MKDSVPIVSHISTVHPLFDVRIFHKQCKSLAKDGYKVNLIITHDKPETIDGVHIIPLPHFRNRITRMFIKPLIAFFKALKTRADLFHFHDPELIPVGLLLKILGKKVIYDVHEDVPSQILDKHWIPPQLRYLISSIFKGIESVSARLFDGIVCATPYITDIFLKRNPNTLNINNYPLVEEFLDLHTIESQKNSKDKIICYVGGITKERGIFELLKALERTDIKLYLAGTPAPNNLLDTLKKEKGWKNVVYYGQVKRKELYEILSKSHIGILLFHPIQNHLNCIPNKLFEYMSAGLPIVASNIPYWQSLLSGFKNIIFIDPLNPKEIGKSIQALLEEPKNCHSRGMEGLQAVKEKFNWKNEEKKLIQLYQTLGIK